MKRTLSWILGALAYIAPPLWAYLEQVSVYEEIGEQYGYVCGLPMFAIIILAGLGAAVLSGFAVLSGWLSYRALPKPRSRWRVAELVVLGIPFVVSGAYVGTLFSF